MRKRRGHRIDLWRTPAETGLHDDISSFVHLSINNFQEGYKVLLKFLEISKKADLTSRGVLQSNSN